MTNNSLILRGGKNIMLYRSYTANGSLSATQYLPPTHFKVGIDNITPVFSDTDLAYAIPILNGTILDTAEGVLTGSDGGDNSTDNTTTYKEGGGAVDNEAQNLIANDTDASKVWSLTLTVTGVPSKPMSCWLYIKDQTTLDKFKTSGTCVRIILGDTVATYYYYDYEAADLSTGWNYLTTNTTIVGELSTNGTLLSDVLDEFAIVITTNNASDEFAAGDVIYDLLRQWAPTDLVKDYVAGYPAIDLVNSEITTKGILLETQANGFLINGHAYFNEDTLPMMTTEDTFTGESKSTTDNFTFTTRDRLL